MFADLMKILGWTIAGAVAVKLLTSTSFGTNFQNIAGGWSSVISSINGAGAGTPQAGSAPAQTTAPPAAGQGG